MRTANLPGGDGGTFLAPSKEGMDENTNRRHKPIWRTALITLSWVLLLSGIVLGAQTAVVMLKTRHLTPDTLSWSTSAFLALLIGSLLNSVARGEKV